MVDEAFILALGRFSNSEIFEDMQMEWIYYTFRIENNNCQICNNFTDISIIYHHVTSLERKLILCPTCSNRIKQLYITPLINSIYAVLEGRKETINKRVIENALRIGLISQSTHDTYLGLIGKKNLYPQGVDYRIGVNGLIIRNYYPNAFPQLDEGEE